jgi:hypothetical protein
MVVRRHGRCVKYLLVSRKKVGVVSSVDTYAHRGQPSARPVKITVLGEGSDGYARGWIKRIKATAKPLSLANLILLWKLMENMKQTIGDMSF